MRDYENITWSLLDKTRSLSNPEISKGVLVSTLLIKYCSHENEKIVLRYGEHFKNDINKACEIIENNNEDLKDVFKTLLHNKVNDQDEMMILIEEVFKELEEMNLNTKEEIKNIINYLISQVNFSGISDIVPTPDAIKELMVGLIKPKKNMKVMDYFSGGGTILLEIYESYKEYEPSLYGEEENIDVYMISKIIMYVNKVKNYNLLKENVYNFNNAKEASFDYVLMDGPVSLKLKEDLKEDSILKYGRPTKTRVDWASYQLGLYTLKDQGKAIVTTATGSLFRTSDKKIRKAIIEDDKIEAIVQLPGSLYHNTSLPTSLIIYNKSKDEEKKNKIIFIDASNESVRKNRKQNTIEELVIKKIINCIEQMEEIEGFAVIEDIVNVAKNDYNLNSNVYINKRIIERKVGKTIILNKVSEVITGVQLNKDDMKTLKKDASHYYLNVKNIEDGQILYDGEERIRAKKEDWYGKYDIKPEDIIITSRGTTTKMAIVPSDYKDSFISNNLSIIRVNKNKYNPYVLLKYLESDIGKLVIENIRAGSTVKVIGASNLSEIKIPDYSSDTLEAMGERIKNNEMRYKKSLEKLKQDFEEENQKIVNELKIY